MTSSQSISLPKELVEKARKAARARGQSLTAYLKILVEQDAEALPSNEEVPEIVVIDAVGGKPFVPDRERGESLEDYEQRKALFDALLNEPRDEDTAL